MAKRKAKEAHPSAVEPGAGRSTNSKSTSHAPTTKPGFFPFARYTSVLGVYTSLLVFVALFLPQTRSKLLSNSSSPNSESPLEALTADPVRTVVSICTGVAVLQGWWGGWIRKWWLEFSLEGSDDEKRVERVRLDKTKFADIRNAWISTVAASFAIHAVLVLFGAHLTSHITHNYSLATLLSLLMIFTPVYTLGLPKLGSDTELLVRRMTLIRLFVELSPRNPVERALVYPVVGTVLGCWVGVIPVPLDWERPWQAWPLTPAFGAFGGYIAGSLAALVVSAGKFFADAVAQERRRTKMGKAN